MSAVLAAEGQAIRLLIAGDASTTRARISRVMQGGGLANLSLVGLARSGAEALRIARATQPDVVTLDLTMPDMDGMACIQEMLRILPRTHILVVGALSDKATALQALKLGARGFVAKPFSDDELKIALLEAVGA